MSFRWLPGYCCVLCHFIVLILVISLLVIFIPLYFLILQIELMKTPTGTPRVTKDTQIDLSVLQEKKWWWHRRTRMERFFILTLYFVILGIIIFSIVLISCLTHADGVSELCFTPECLHEARTLLESMNFSVDPCVDFYRFVCGKYESRTDLGKRTVGKAFVAVKAKTFHQMVSILEEPIKEQDKRPTKLAKTLYGLCVDTNKIDRFGFEPLLKLLKSLGGWPVLVHEGDSWDEASWLWTETLYKFRTLGIDYSFLISLDLHDDPTGVRIIKLDSPEGSPFSRLSKDLADGPNSIYRHYQNMVDVAILLGATRDLAERDMNATFTLGLKLAVLMPKSDVKEYRRVTIKNLTETIPSIPWLEYIKNIISLPISIDETERVIVVKGEYMESIGNLMSTTPKRVLANYLLWRAIKSTINYLPKKIRMENESESTDNDFTPPLRQQECSDEVGKRMMHAVGAEYVTRYVSKKLKPKVSYIVGRIKAEMDLTLRTVEWMDEKTRNNAIKKNTAMGATVAYPDELLDSEKVDMIYKGLEINNDESYFEVILNVTKFLAQLKYRNFREKVNKRDWNRFPKVYLINAAYSHTDNLIKVPAAILQGKFYSTNRPNYLNFGGIGSVIGHEVTHGFDSKGHRYDKDGMIADWWDQETKREFLEKALCMVDQYSNYTLLPSNITLRGRSSLGENIADNGGYKLAYRAYRRWAAINNIELKLPGFQNFTHNQMIWISIAANWCFTPVPENRQAKYAFNVHPPAEFRVKGPLSNIKEFSQDFHCPIGSPMNPPEKCTVW